MRTLRRGLSTRTARAVGQWVMPVERGPVSVKFKAVSANDNLDERGLAKVSSHLDTLELCLNLQKYDQCSSTQLYEPTLASQLKH